MQKYKRTLAAILTALITVSITGCGGSSASGENSSGSSKADSSAQSTSTDEKTLKEWPEIEIWAGYVRDNSEVTKVQELWEKVLGFKTRVKNVTGDVDTALNLALASGGFKDIAVLPKNDVWNNSIIKSGSVMEVSEFLTDDKYGNVAAIPQQYLDLNKDQEGKHWYIPTEWDANPDDPWPGWTRKAFLVNDDLLAKTNITEDSIKTLDDFEGYLSAVSKLTMEDGTKYIPTTYTDDINTVLTAFGVKTGQVSGSVACVDKVGDEFEFLYDQPNYKKAYQWLNKITQEGLMDQESVIQKSDIRKEKVYSGKYASIMGFEDFSSTKTGDPYRSFSPIEFPLAEGVDKPGIQFVINPYPKTAVYISKDTKNLDAILAFMDWTLEQVPERTMELSEGVVGYNWNWIDKPYGAWSFDPTYEQERSNPATRANLQNELYMLGTMSREWYPWWTKQQPADAGQYINVKLNEEIYSYGTHENIHSWDNVKSVKGSKWEKYGPTVQQIVTESTAKLILSQSDDEFEANWTEFMSSLETKGHWNELKAEWHDLYAQQTAVTGEW